MKCNQALECIENMCFRTDDTRDTSARALRHTHTHQYEQCTPAQSVSHEPRTPRSLHAVSPHRPHPSLAVTQRGPRTPPVKSDDDAPRTRGFAVRYAEVRCELLV